MFSLWTQLRKGTILFTAGWKETFSPAVWQLANQCRSNNQQTDPNESQRNPEKEKVIQKFS